MASEPRNKRSTKVRNKIISISLIALLLITSILMFTWYLSNRNRINKGIYIDDVDMSRLSIAQAKDIVVDRSHEVKRDFSMTILCKGEEWTYSHGDIGLDLDVEGAISKAHAEGRQGNIFTQLAQSVGIKNKGKRNIDTRLIYDGDALRKQLNKIKKTVDKKPVDAKIDFLPEEDEKFIISSGSSGRLFDVEDVISLIDKELENNKLSIKINYEPEVIQARVDTRYYEGKTEQLSSFSTDLGNSSENRTHNVKLSAEAFNGMIIEPGQTISFNETVGNTSLERGFKLAPVIQPDKSLEDSAGGGVCQTSSTLYNAVLLSGLEVVQSARHSYPTTYVAKGLDATVYMSPPYIDLKFKNTKDYPVYIHSFFKDNKIYFDLYGQSLEGDKRIELRTEEYETVDAPEPEYIEDLEGIYVVYEGEEYEKVSSREGYKVRVYKEIYQGENLIDSQMLYDHYYRPIKGLVYTGIEGGRFVPKEELNEQGEREPDIADGDAEEALIYIRIPD
ncbi:MAG TPA: VanW family protein [Bacillota bacterium]|nr:VanW family protein [Bacillota bacterium]